MSKGKKGGGAGGGAAPSNQGGGGWSDKEMRDAGINPNGMDPADIETLKSLGYRPGDIAGVAGKTEAGTMTVTVSRVGKELHVYMTVQEKHLAGASIRSIHHLPDGTKYLYNHTYMLKEEFQGKGLGREMLREQVKTAQRLGIKEIRTDAARGTTPWHQSEVGKNLVGYYSWASLGYNAALTPDRIAKLRANAAAAGVSVPANLGKVKDIHELFRTPGGRELWKAAGFSIDMTFDTRKGSVSNSILNAKK